MAKKRPKPSSIRHGTEQREFQANDFGEVSGPRTTTRGMVEYLTAEKLPRKRLHDSKKTRSRSTNVMPRLKIEASRP